MGVCSNCSKRRRPVALRDWERPVRVCDWCAAKKEQLQGELVISEKLVMRNFQLIGPL